MNRNSNLASNLGPPNDPLDIADDFIEACRQLGSLGFAVYSEEGRVIRFKGPPLTHAQIAETLRNMADLFDRMAKPLN